MNVTCGCRERQKLLNEIGKIDFIIVELNLYLDTHPFDQQALEKIRYFQSKKKQLVQEYTEAYGPLMRDCIDDNAREWKWALQDWPWEGGYH